MAKLKIFFIQPAQPPGKGSGKSFLKGSALTVSGRGEAFLHSGISLFTQGHRLFYAEA
jgi:hypothetical protein